MARQAYLRPLTARCGVTCETAPRLSTIMMEIDLKDTCTHMQVVFTFVSRGPHTGYAVGGALSSDPNRVSQMGRKAARTD